jgi:hypothetical protein
MTTPYIGGLPRVGSERTATPRLVFRDGQISGWKSGGGIIDSLSRDPGNTNDTNVLRPGLILGKNTSDGNLYPSIFGVTSGAYSAGGLTLSVAAAVAVAINLRVGSSGTLTIAGPPSANGVVAEETVTYSAINTTTGDITISALSNSFVAGSFVRANDGSEDPLTVIPDGWGVNMFDVDGSTAIDQPLERYPIAGVLIAANLLPAWPSDTSLRNWLLSMLDRGAGGPKFVVDTNL